MRSAHGERTHSMSITTTSVASVLNALIEVCKDGQEGFQSAAENVERADVKAFLNELSRERRTFASDLQALAVSLGDEPATYGGCGGGMHRGWMDLRAALAEGDEHAILAECEHGEDAASAEYREAVGHDDLPWAVRRVVRQQYMAIQGSHDRVRDMRDSFTI